MWFNLILIILAILIDPFVSFSAALTTLTMISVRSGSRTLLAAGFIFGLASDIQLSRLGGLSGVVWMVMSAGFTLIRELMQMKMIYWVFLQGFLGEIIWQLYAGEGPIDWVGVFWQIGVSMAGYGIISWVKPKSGVYLRD